MFSFIQSFNCRRKSRISCQASSSMPNLCILAVFTSASTSGLTQLPSSFSSRTVKPHALRVRSWLRVRPRPPKAKSSLLCNPSGFKLTAPHAHTIAQSLHGVVNVRDAPRGHRLETRGREQKEPAGEPRLRNGKEGSEKQTGTQRGHRAARAASDLRASGIKQCDCDCVRLCARLRSMGPCRA